MKASQRDELGTTAVNRTGEIMDECIHGLGPIECCVICNGRAERERKDADRITARWPARYPGHCAVCREDIAPNDPMGKTADGRYVCECSL